MADEVAVQLINVGTPEIVKLFAFKAEHLMTCDHGDMDALAVHYVAHHGRHLQCGGTGQSCACCPPIARQIAFYFRFALGPSTTIWRMASGRHPPAGRDVIGTTRASIQ